MNNINLQVSQSYKSEEIINFIYQKNYHILENYSLLIQKSLFHYYRIYDRKSITILTEHLIELIDNLDTIIDEFYEERNIEVLLFYSNMKTYNRFTEELLSIEDDDTKIRKLILDNPIYESILRILYIYEELTFTKIMEKLNVKSNLLSNRFSRLFEIDKNIISKYKISKNTFYKLTPYGRTLLSTYYSKNQIYSSRLNDYLEDFVIGKNHKKNQIKSNINKFNISLSYENSSNNMDSFYSNYEPRKKESFDLYNFKDNIEDSNKCYISGYLLGGK